MRKRGGWGGPPERSPEPARGAGGGGPPERFPEPAPPPSPPSPAWSLVAVHFVLLPFGTSSDWPPIFFSVLLFCASFPALNPVLSLYFDPGLARALRGPENERRIGTLAATSTGSAGGSRRGGPQQHAGSVVSHFDPEGNQMGEEMKRAADVISRKMLKKQLFGERTAPADDSEAQALELGLDLVFEIERGILEEKKQSNQLVQLWGNKQSLKAAVTVRASVKDVAAFLHDYESHYFNDTADMDLMVRDRYKIEDSGGRSHTTYLRVRPPKGRYRDRAVCSKNTCSGDGFGGDGAIT